jgi:molecular chaperone DnaK
MAAQNRTLGKFHLTGLPPAPRGLPQIEVTFDIDANGILNVTAKDRGTNKEQKITITGSSGLNKDEVQKAVREAESHSAEDKKRREAAEAKNQLDTLVYSTQKLLDENGDKIPAADKTTVEAAIADAKKVLESQSSDPEALKRAAADLQKASYKVAEALYKSGAQAEATGTGAPGGEQPQGGTKADDVIDAEVVEEKK